jgi:hypothetical protein
LLFGAVMKKTALTLLFLLALLISASAAAVFVHSVRANPYVYSGEVPPATVGAKPPVITILSPKDNNTYDGSNVLLSVNVVVGETSVDTVRSIKFAYYKGDWEQNKTYITSFYKHEFSINLTVPEGKHELSIGAYEEGSYWVDYDDDRFTNGKGRGYSFHITGSESVVFTVDTTSPTVSVLSVKNETYRTSEVPLDFTVNESVSQINYCLDGHENVAVAGNMTLMGLSNGEHSLTVYATDEAGNNGASETIIFSVDVPFPTALVAVAAVSATSVVAGLLVYFKKHRQ